MTLNNFEKYSKVLIILSILFIILILSISIINSEWCWIEIAYWVAGIIVPLITLASFFLVLSNLKVHQKQLLVQKEEMKITQKELKDQNKINSLQRFESTFFLLVEKLTKSFNEIMESEPNRFDNILINLREEISHEFEIKCKTLNNPSDTQLNKVAYKAIYDGCLNTEQQYRNLGLEYIYSLFRQAIKLLITSQPIIDDDDYYFDFILLELNSNVLDLLFYMIIYHDEASFIKYFNRKDLVSRINKIDYPIDLTEGRSFWKYILSNAGELNPYQLD